MTIADDSPPPYDNKIFFYGDAADQPAEDMRSVNFTDNMQSNLSKKGFDKPRTIQSFSWNLIFNGKSLLMIAPRASGKTLGFLPSLLSLLANGREAKTATQDNESDDELQSPMAIIFTKSSREVEVLNKLCQILSPHLNIVAAAGYWNLEQQARAVLSGCDLLIITPPCFDRLAQCIDIDHESIKYMVFDNLDAMYDNSPAEIQSIFREHVGRAEAKDSTIQLIVTATKWRKAMRSLFVREYVKTVLIADPLEAAVMGRAHFHLVIDKELDRDAHLLNLLKTMKWRFRKTLVIFSCRQEIEEFEKRVQNEFNMMTVTVLESVEKHDKAFTNDICRLWQRETSGSMSLFLVTDDVLQSQRAVLHRVQHIIHYSLSKCWIHRHCASNFWYKQHIAEKDVERSERPEVTILLDENQLQESTRLLRFLSDQRIITHLSNDARDKIEAIMSSTEEAKLEEGSTVQLCNIFQKFGEDATACNCELRHAFIPADKTQYLPENRQIKFKIVGIFHPLHYSITITHIQSAVGTRNWISIRTNNEHLTLELRRLQLYMNDARNATAAQIIKVGELYCYKDLNDDTWYRCKAISIPKVPESASSPYKVRVLLVDKGDTITVKSSNVKVLPDQFKKHHPQTCDLRVTNMTPYDSEKLFDQEIIEEVENIVAQVRRNNDYFACDVALSYGNTIVCKNIRAFKQHATIETFDLKKFLLEKHFAEKNDSIFEKILASATKAQLVTAPEEVGDVTEAVAAHSTANQEDAAADHLLKMMEDIENMDFGILSTPDAVEAPQAIEGIRYYPGGYECKDGE